MRVKDIDQEVRMKGLSKQILSLIAFIIIVVGSLLALAHEGDTCLITVHQGESIQEAIDRAPAGSTICLDPGIWREHVKITKSITIQGAKRDQTVLDGDNRSYPIIWVEPSLLYQTISVTISNLLINNRQGELSDEENKTYSGAILVEALSQVTISNSTIAENNPYGVEVGSLAEVKMLHCDISNNEVAGIRVSGGRATIMDCSISNNEDGIAVSKSGEVTILNSAIVNNRGSGVETAEAGYCCPAFSIESDEDGNMTYVRLGRDPALIITYSDISRNQLSGIELEHMIQADICSCTISRNGEFGILIKDSSRAAISFSAISQNGKDGVYLDSWAANTFSHWVGYDWETINWGEPEATLSHSTVTDNEGKGIFLDGRGQATISDCSVSGNHDSGGYLANYASIIITDTTINDNDKYGLFLSNKTSASILTCTLNHNEYDGVWLKDEAYADIIGSAASSNRSGVELMDSSQAMISKCTVSQNREAGICLWSLSKTTVLDSLISKNNGAGVVLRLSTEVTLEGNKILKNLGGVKLYQSNCYETDWVFTGYVSGKGNIIPAPEESDGNAVCSVCPSTLSFLATLEGGTLDLRKEGAGRR